MSHIKGHNIGPSSTDIMGMAQAIVGLHHSTFAPCVPQTVPKTTETSPVYQATLQACSALGFIAIDAEYLARAWQAQTERIGSFDANHWPDTAADFGLTTPPESACFSACPQTLGLYAVLPDAQWVGRMARAGVPTVQLRYKAENASRNSNNSSNNNIHHIIRQEVQAAVQAVQGTPARLFINDHWEAALEAGAYGIHLGQEDLDAMRPEDLQRIRAAGLRLGVSTHGYAEMLRAAAVGPSYIALGAVFPTTLKRMMTAPQGLARLAAYVRLMQQHPLVAIGGIGIEQFAAIRATGVGSIAVVRALVNAQNPEAAAAALLQAMA